MLLTKDSSVLSSFLPINLPVFLLASLILLLTPGPAVLYIVTRSVNQGRRAGLASVLGIELGNLGQVLAATLGLSAILLTSALAFSIVKYAGAAYLIYLGIRKLLTPITAEAGVTGASQNLRGTFLQGALVAILNPKTALFFLAFLPQFVDAGRGSVGPQFLVLGLIFVAMAITTDSLYALLSGTAGRWLRRNIWFARFQRYVAGTVYIGLGLTAALTGNKD
jgi:threonine/homoserine/homoserine lactone efflux protein